MIKTIDLTVTLKLVVDATMEASEFYESLETTLRNDLDEMLAHCSDCVKVVAAHDPEITLQRETDLRHLLEPMGEIADIWSVEDVIEIRPDLNRQQAMKVLQLCANTHDANFGITWDTLSYAAEVCFGEASELTELAG